jgi:hypothetical protein
MKRTGSLGSFKNLWTRAIVRASERFIFLRTTLVGMG